MLDPNITQQIKEYLESDLQNRDYAKGAELLLRISANRVRHRMFMARGPEKFADVIDKALSDNYKFRLAKLTHEQVVEMKRKSDAVVEESDNVEVAVRNGRRPDHDSLPDEIKACYIQTLDCLRKERELHLQIRRLALADAPCPDSEIYPFVKEILRLDDLRLSLWQRYDSFKNQVS